MVSPIYVIILFLGTAFLLGFLDKIKRTISLSVFMLALAAIFYINTIWLIDLFPAGEGLEIFTAGFNPPFSINLYLGQEEIFILFFVNLLALLNAVYMMSRFKRESVYQMILYLTLFLGLNGMIITRDLFNIFVFMEIASISTYALISMGENKAVTAAGFKYMIAGGISSVLYLLGTIYIYRFTGTLNLDGAIAISHLLVGKAGMLAVYLVIAGVLIELKPFPANGWALDVYQAADSGIITIIAAASSGAFLFLIYKLLPFLNLMQINYLAGLGLLTFTISNLMGLKQINVRRLLGYSSIAQMGLLITTLALIQRIAPFEIFFKFMIVGGFFINHFIAKVGLFWLAGIVKKDNVADWSILRRNSPFMIAFAVFIFALVGLPPFPGFWAKWSLIIELFNSNMSSWVWPILIGSLLEAVYLLKWFGIAFKPVKKVDLSFSLWQFIPLAVSMVGMIFIGLEFTRFTPGISYEFMYPLIFVAGFYMLRFLPLSMKNILAMVIIAYFGYNNFPQMRGITRLFGVIFYGGSLIFMFSFFARKKDNSAFLTAFLIMILSMGQLLKAVTMLEFFFGWELMTLSSYLLVLMGNKGEKPALTYILFSLAGAYVLISGFGIAYAKTGLDTIFALENLKSISAPVYILLAVGFLIKSGAIGLHIWLPESYSETYDDITPAFSGILSKAGIFGLFLISFLITKPMIGSINLETILGWIGGLTAFFGALMAIFQEDIKKLLAYSSMGQVGYIILALAVNSHLGWVAALYHTFNHLLFKGLLFIAVAGLIYRVKTRKMYEMGGLIKRMPLTFIAVLMGIIALSGVPPLTGFGGKWLLYTALIEKSWHLQAGLAFFASTIAFLYCFRLIHTMFLGQLKPKFKNIKETSIWFLIPQYILIFGIMAFSMYPNLILKPIMNTVSGHFSTTVAWDGYTVISSLGYWNGNAVMMVTMGVFMVPLIWLLLRVRSVTKVKQFNIVYAAERPERPEVTHFAHNFFAPYQKALGFLVKPVVTRFWFMISEWFNTLGGALRHIYTGNGQTYALHIIIFVVVFYLIWGV